MKAVDLAQNAHTYYAKTKGSGYALTLWSWPDLDARDIARKVGTRKLPHPLMRQSTVGAILDAGYDLVPTGEEGHLALRLPSPPTDTDWATLRRIFRRAQRNPVGRKEVLGQ